MADSISRRWSRDLVVGVLVSVLTASAFVPFTWAAQRRQDEQVEAARQEARVTALRAEEMVAEAEQQRSLAQRALLAQAAGFVGLADRAAAEPLHVTTAAVTPEVPQDAWLLIDKKASSYRVGDIVVFQDGGRNYLGRVVAMDKSDGRVTVGRNGEANRQIAVADLLGRGVLNTR